MRLISHIRLGLSVMARYPMGIIESIAYLYGNIQPDVCFFSYLRNVAPGDEKRGHNYSTALGRIDSMEDSLVPDGIVAAYTLGKITHYAADIFTFPHNPSIFHGTLKEHMKYERKLDRQLQEMLEEDIEFMPENFLSGITSALEELHGEYEKNEPSTMNDISFIIYAALLLRTSFSYESKSRRKRTVAII